MERIGVLGRRPYGPSGELRLLLPNDEFVLVESRWSHGMIAAQYDLDRVVVVPEIVVFTATYLDGPLKGRTNPYVQGEVGARITISRPTPAGREVLTYELIALPTGTEPGKLRHVS
ncbi:hypothetical protein ACWGE0_41185 [Lentzea sp. NPDC054927]